MMKRWALLLWMVFPLSAQCQDYIFVFLNNKPDKKELPKEEVDNLMRGHFENITRLAKEGKLLVAGPMEGGGGIFIFKSVAVDQVRGWLKGDPGVQAERWNLEILPFHIRAGSLCLAPEPYEMVMYDFIRYRVNMTKGNVQQAPQTTHQHDEYLKRLETTGNVLAEGIFGEDGGVLIMKGELQKEVIEADPSLSEDLYHIEFKKLYVAKGAFCEK